jgi:hypothetical protein
MRDQPLPGAVDVLNRFAKDWDVHFLSSRNWPDAQRITEAWLKLHGFPFQSVNLVPSHGHKIEFLKNHRCELFIDDFTGRHEFGRFDVHHDLIEAMPCPYEVFHPQEPDYWRTIEGKYFAAIPNGELFWQLMVRNLEWWRVNRDYERGSRARYYDNFCRAALLTREHLYGKHVAEVGAGPFGGLVRHLKPYTTSETFIDILANAQRVLRFIDWGDADFVDCPVESIRLPDKSVDVLLSYNAIDHGSDVIKGMQEIARVSKECFVAFDCKANTAPPHDRVDHYQIVEFKRVCECIEQMVRDGKIKSLQMGDLRSISPGFHFEHNWDFPIFWCHAIVP